MSKIENQNKNPETKNDLTISKEELKNLEKELETKKEFKNLENEIITKNYSILFPQYKEELKKYENDPETLKWYLFLLDFWKKILWNQTFETLTKSIPLKEIVPFLYELIKIEQEKDLLQVATIVLTNEEIKELKKLLATKATKTKLNEFIEKQLFENVTTAELIQWTSVENKFNKVNENPFKTMNNIDYFWYKFLQDENLNISKDTERNMATWITISLAYLYSKLPNLSNFNLNSFKNPKVLAEFLIKNKKWTESIKEKLDNLFDVIRELKLGNNSEKYEILMDPYKFHQLIMELFAGLSKEQIKEKIIKSKKEKEIIPDHEKIKQETKKIFDEFGNKLSLSNAKTIWEVWNLLDKLKNTKNYMEWVKTQMKDYLYNSADYLFELKNSLENFGGINIWKYIKKIINVFLELLWFKNGWDDFAKEVKEREFKNILEYLKKACSLNEIKKEKNNKNPSLFFEGFKNNLNELSQIQPKWSLSYESLKYLKYQGNLESFFEWKNFEKLLKKANINEKEFFKDTFKIEEETKNNKKIKIWYVDFEKIDQIIKKTCKLPETYQDPNKIENSIAWAYLKENEDYKINNPEIKKIVDYYEKKFKENVKMLFGFDNFSYKKYIQAIAEIESKWNYKAKNTTSGALWKYQFMPSTLWDYKKEICPNKKCNQQELNQVFLNSPALQEKIMGEYTMSHLIQIYNKIKNLELPAPKSIEDLVKMLAKSHFTWVWNLSKNFSDGNMYSNDYASLASKNYNNLA